MDDRYKLPHYKIVIPHGEENTSRLVQGKAFELNYIWPHGKKRNAKCVKKQYLYFENGYIYCGSNHDDFDRDSNIEISPEDFMRLPKHRRAKNEK